MIDAAQISVKYFTAIAIHSAGAAKYHNILNKPAALARFERYVIRTFPGATHVNYYGKKGEPKGGEFLYQKKLY